MDRRRRASEIVDLIDLEQDGLGNVVTDHLEPIVTGKMGDIHLAAGKEVIEAEHFVPFVEKPFAKMRADEPGASSHKYSHSFCHRAHRERQYQKVNRLIRMREPLTSWIICRILSKITSVFSVAKFFYLKCFSKKPKIRAYSSVQLSGRTKP